MITRTAACLSAVVLTVASCSSTSTSGPPGEDGGAEGASGSGAGSTSGGTGPSSSSGSTGSSGSSSSSGSSGSDASGAVDAQTVYGEAGTCASCGPTEVCVEDVVSGGALFLVDDAGQCPAGRVPSGGVCVTPPTYHCASLPSACNTALGSTAVAHCTCAPQLCPAPYMCSDPTPTLTKCALAAP